MMKTIPLLNIAIAIATVVGSADAFGMSRRAVFQNAASAAAAVATLSTTTTANANAAADIQVGGKMILGEENIMSQKGHGTSETPVQENLLYGVSTKLSDKICNFNRHFAESGGYFQYTTFEDEMKAAKGPVTFYDSVTGAPLFQAPIGRTVDDFIDESRVHGWPSFRDTEVVWDNVRVLKSSGETVSVSGTHLGHNLPDRKGNRYCINLVSIAGQPVNQV